MNGYIFFRMLWVMVLMSLVLLAAFLAFAVGTFSRISTEVSFRHSHGVEWQVEFEKKYGPLGQYHTKIAATAFGAVAIPSLSTWLYTLVRKKPYGSSRKKNHRERRMSNTELTMQARSRTLLWNYLGLIGIAAGVLLVIFRWRIFADHADEMVLGMFVFCAGYCSVIGGCWWWLRAKAWPEAVIFIGIAPLFIIFIPYVRLIFLAAPLLLPTGMVMMTAILLVVIAVLPDKSGVDRKRRKMNWKDIEQKQRP